MMGIITAIYKSTEVSASVTRANIPLMDAMKQKILTEESIESVKE